MDSTTLGYLVMGAGSLANAWGNYKTGKDANKLAKEQFDYEKSKDTLIAQNLADAQSEFETGFDSVFKPKKKTTTTTTDLTVETPTVVV